MDSRPRPRSVPRASKTWTSSAAPANTYDVAATTVGTSTSFVGGSGNDKFDITPIGANLDAIGGQVTADGRGGTDVLVINDSASTAVAAYNLGVDRLSRIVGSSVARINLDDLEAVTVLGGSAGNTYNVEQHRPEHAGRVPRRQRRGRLPRQPDVAGRSARPPAG